MSAADAVSSAFLCAEMYYVAWVLLPEPFTPAMQM